MNKKGFTLVELLAVVVILALLALVAGTAITKMVKDSKTKLSTTQKNLIKSAAEAWAADNSDRLPESNVCIYVTVDELVGTGYLKGDIIDPATGEKLSNDYSVKICGTTSSYGALVYTYDVDETGSGASGEDSGGSGGSGGSTIPCQGDVDVGDIITCDTENFYVLEDEGSRVLAITEKLVDVNASVPTQQAFTCETLSSINSCPRFATINNVTYQGTTYNLGYWLDPNATSYATIKSNYTIEETVTGTNNYSIAYVFDSNSVIYNQLNGYKTYLTSLGLKDITVTLPSYTQVKALGCDAATGSCASAPEWVYNSNYWLGSATNKYFQDAVSGTRTAIHPLAVSTDGHMYAMHGASKGEVGIRPVVRIKKNQIG